MKVKKEKSAGAVIFRRGTEEVYYLLLLSDHWGFPKGHIEEGEDEISTLCREVKEETGIDELIVKEGFKETVKYFFRNVFDKKQREKSLLIRKTVVFYLVETNEKEVELSQEHKNYKWLSYNEAYHELTYKNYKKVLKKANKFIN